MVDVRGDALSRPRLPSEGGQRVRLLSADGVPALGEERDPRLRRLCVWRCLKVYVERSRDLRVGDTKQLFVAYGRSQRGQPVSTRRISQWLKLTITFAYATRNIAAPSGVQGHQVRKQAVSMAELAGVSRQAICEAATWSSTCMLLDFTG